MSTSENPLIDWREGLPFLNGRCEQMPTAISEWLQQLDQTLGSCFIGSAEMTNLRVLSTSGNRFAEQLRDHAHRCRSGLLRLAGGDAFSGLPDDIVILHFHEMEAYYGYIQVFYPEGEFGGSAGVQIRTGYPHIVVCGEGYQTGGTIAHELLHLAVMHRELPQWVEEGLAQMYEVDMGSGTTLSFYQEEIEACRAYWRENDLAQLWHGAGFSATENTQKYAYMIAEILIRNLASRFGRRSIFKRKQETAFQRFIQAAHYEDAGEQAAIEIFGIGLEEIAAEFIGPP